MSKRDGVEAMGREFWINTITMEVHLKEIAGVEGNVRVIEKSAFDKLQSENTTLRAHLSHVRRASISLVAECKLNSVRISAMPHLNVRIEHLEHAIAVTSGFELPLKDYSAEDHYRECYGEGEKR